MPSVDSYRIKRVRFFGRKVPILCQNENGPCPLLAIGNVLLLQSNISIHPDLSEISFNELTQLVAGFLLDSNPPHEDVRISVNQQTQLDTVIKMLPRLQYGLDVNVRFNSIRGFEYTEEMATFDMTGITLLHGWILDPEDTRTAPVIEGMSYNKLVEKLLDFRSALAAIEAPGRDKQEVDAAGTGHSVGSCHAESMDGQKEDSAHVGSTADEEEAVGPERAVEGDEAAAVCDTSGPSGEDEACHSVSADKKGSDSMLDREGASTDKCAHATSAAIADAESVKVATTLKEGQVAEDFFRETASQLTYYGLSRLHQEVRERQLCVFFRNNHFSTMFKYEGKLYLLITDLGYAREPSVVWEQLDQIDGNTEYADSDFCRSSRCGPAGGEHDEDYMLALALQQEDASALASTSPNQSAVLGDEAVAMALQGEERGLLEQRIGRDNVDSTLAGAPPFREDRDRRRPVSESGSSCCVQ